MLLYLRWVAFDSNGKMETRHPGEGYFGSEFPAICNHYTDMAARSRKTLQIFEKFLRFFGKVTPYGKMFIATQIDVLCSNFMKFGRREIGEIVRYLPNKKTNKISPGFPAVATARIAPKICQGQPPTTYSRVLQISSKSIHFPRSYCRTREHPQNAP